MKALNVLTLVLVIVGGLNWGLVGAAQFDLVAAIFGSSDAMLARVVYLLVGVSAVYQISRVVAVAKEPQGRIAHA